MADSYIWSAVDATSGPQFHYRAGDLVTTVTGYPTLYEVLHVQPDGLLRVRGNNWAQGYSALVDRRQVRPSIKILRGRSD